MLLSASAIPTDYLIVIALSVIIIVSHLFNVVSNKTNIPSVLLLLVLGIAMQWGFEIMGIHNFLETIDRFDVLPVIGTMGLILIVLEAALDLELSAEKWPVIWRSFVVAFLSLGVTATAIAFIFNYFLFMDSMVQCFLYAIPLSIMSSAIVIPSVTNMVTDKKEFMIYESTFSDILGIMAFQALVGNIGVESAADVAGNVLLGIVTIIILSIIISGVLVYIFQKMTSHVKLFLVIAILMLLYAIGKVAHLSSLVLILIFGLMLGNPELFFRGRFKKLIHAEKLKPLLRDFHIITLESAFVLRTFFFVIFGLTIALSSLLSVQVVIVSICVIAATYLIRYILIKIFKANDIDPLLFLTPRGLITVLLFFAIPSELISQDFNPGILLFAIIGTSLIMTSALIRYGKKLSLEDPVGDLGDELEEYTDDLAEDAGIDEQLPPTAH
jgi:NhaP-type Na+/H+ or K+/H+ antiporter